MATRRFNDPSILLYYRLIYTRLLLRATPLRWRFTRTRDRFLPLHVYIVCNITLISAQAVVFTQVLFYVISNCSYHPTWLPILVIVKMIYFYQNIYYNNLLNIVLDSRCYHAVYTILSRLSFTDEYGFSVLMITTSHLPKNVLFARTPLCNNITISARSEKIGSVVRNVVRTYQANKY